MKMESYLKEIEFAVTPILQAVWHEHADFANVQAEVGRLFKNVELQSGTTHSTDNKVIDAYVLETLFCKNGEAHVLKQRIVARTFAVAALSGTLLQFAKQGISIVHGGLDHCPNGRAIGSQTLKSIIWYGRNQSLHWEEGKLKAKVRECFRRLAIEFGLMQFGMFQGNNRGFAVVQLLGWKTFNDFKSDLLLLG